MYTTEAIHQAASLMHTYALLLHYNYKHSGRTPLDLMDDGSPDWDYVGVVSYLPSSIVAFVFTTLNITYPPLPLPSSLPHYIYYIIGPVFFFLRSIRHVSPANVTSLAPTFSTLRHCQVTFDGLLNSCSLA